MGGRNTSNLPLVGGQPFLEASQQPAFEQRGYRVAKPLTEPDVACPGAGLGGFPCYRLGQGGDRAGLEEHHLTSG